MAKHRKTPVQFASDPDRQELYLHYLSMADGPSGVWPGKTGAAALAGVSYSSVKLLRDNDPEFAERERQALEAYADKVRREVDRRGRRGVLKGIYHQGQRVGRERQYSDKLLAAQAAAHCDEFRRTDKVDVNVSGGLDLAGAFDDLEPEEREMLRALLEKVKARRAERGKGDA